jgi:phospholipid/cholesterol/gamma-HCH transport system substrate-binding protein
MKKFNVEIAVGIFLILGFLAFAYLSVRLGGVHLFSSDTYTLDARFTSISGLKEGANVEIAGVRVGNVSGVRLDRENYEAIVHISIHKDVKIQDDSIASIRTAGIIGDRYINITPGGSDEYIEDGGEIEETESAINLEELVSKYIFESK